MRMKKRKRNPILMKTAVKKKTKEGRETEKEMDDLQKKNTKMKSVLSELVKGSASNRIDLYMILSFLHPSQQIFLE